MSRTSRRRAEVLLSRSRLSLARIGSAIPPNDLDHRTSDRWMGFDADGFATIALRIRLETATDHRSESRSSMRLAFVRIS